MNINEIFPVLVLYNCTLEKSQTVKSIEDTCGFITRLYVFDNSPKRNYQQDDFKYRGFNIKYYHDETNPGLSAAYNSALKLCIEKGSKWLLLLDQDTTFTQAYFNEINGLILDQFDKNLVAVIPKVLSLDGSLIIAPVKMGLGGVNKSINLTKGIIKSKITGINSGTLLNVEYMEALGGFTNKYSLDMLDHWYFKIFYESKKDIYLLDSTIFQDLSVSNNFEYNISIPRYRQMLRSERMFFKDEMWLSYFVYKLKLFARFLKQLRYDEKKFSKITLIEFFKV